MPSSYSALRQLAYRFKHERRVATGHFKVQLSEKDWNAGMAAEALSLAIKDQASGAVMLTVLVEKVKK
jgi:hypothetical protein